MIVPKNPCLSLSAIADSGQCFRWRQREDGYVIPAWGRVLRAREMPDGALALSCTEEDDMRLWRDYFDLDTDYEAMSSVLPAADDYLRAAAEYGRGIRILRQDPWETLVSFLISQRKNIPAIRQAVEKLCQTAGRVIEEDEEGPIYAFPSPPELKRLGEDGLRACGLGYRAPYVPYGFSGWRKNAIPAAFGRNSLHPSRGSCSSICTPMKGIWKEYKKTPAVDLATGGFFAYNVVSSSSYPARQ